QGQYVIQSGRCRVARQDGYRQGSGHVAEVVGYKSGLSWERQGSGVDGASEKALGRQTGYAGQAAAIAGLVVPHFEGGRLEFHVLVGVSSPAPAKTLPASSKLK